MEKFDGKWINERVKDLVLTHQGRTHSETAASLTKKWGVFISRDSVKNKTVALRGENRGDLKTVDLEPQITRDSFDKKQSDEKLTGKRRYFVTTAIAGCSLNKGFYKAVQKFCHTKNAKLVVLPMRGVVSKNEEFTKDVLDALKGSFYTEYTFNSNLEAFDLGLGPTQVNPLSGLARLAQKKASLLIASPKQSMETIPVSNVGIPHILQATGAITTSMYTENRIGMLAEEDHVIGGIIVEVQDSKIFHLRQVQADAQGGFYDLDKYYSYKGVANATAEAFVLGDIHCGNEDPTAMKAWKEVMRQVKPKHIFLHDILDCRSISHHEQHNMTKKANRPDLFKLLSTELNGVSGFLHGMTKEFPNITFNVVRSNHDEHLDRYLDEGRFLFDHHNYRLALQLALLRVDGFNPLAEYVKGKIGTRKNLRWLRRDEDFKIAGVQLSAHGDIGPNGSKGTIMGTERSYYNAITAHLHSPRILRKSFQVGTSTKYRLSYTSGPSNWLHASCLLYKNGMKQMIVSIGGEWRI